MPISASHVQSSPSTHTHPSTHVDRRHRACVSHVNMTDVRLLLHCKKSHYSILAALFVGQWMTMSEYSVHQNSILVVLASFPGPTRPAWERGYSNTGGQLNECLAWYSCTVYMLGVYSCYCNWIPDAWFNYAINVYITSTQSCSQAHANSMSIGSLTVHTSVAVSNHRIKLNTCSLTIYVTLCPIINYTNRLTTAINCIIKLIAHVCTC